jgi:hypothetical protein
MLNEYAPAWCLLVAAAAVALVRMAPPAASFAPRWSPRVFALVLLAAAWTFGMAYGTPRRLASYRQQAWPPTAAAVHLPRPGLVFVHGSWSTRVAMQLAAHGMRLDSLEAALQHNSTCQLQLWLDSGARNSPLAFEGEEELRQVLLTPDSRIRVGRGEVLAPGCVRQAQADRFGITEVGGFLWYAGLPGLPEERTLFARDLGPDINRRLIQVMDRPVYMLHVDSAGRPGLWPYEQAVRTIWGGTPAPVSHAVPVAAGPAIGGRT